MRKAYIGDGVYVQLRPAMFSNELVLTTERGDNVPYNTIVLGPNEWEALVAYVKGLKEEPSEQAADDHVAE